MKKVDIIWFISFLFYLILSSRASAQVIYNPFVEKVAEGIQFTEGPVWMDGVGLLFTDIPQNKIFVWNPGSDATVFLEPTGKANGLAIDAEGSLIMCQHFDRQVGKYIGGDSIAPLATHYNGKRLNSPNDLTIKSDGSIFFTDPPFGLNDEGGTSETGYSGIYRLSPSGDVQLLDSTLNYPNGITFSPDESKLYVSESDVADVYVWDVLDDTTIDNKTLFYNIPGQWADGMKSDASGHLYITGPVGLWIIAPDGTLVLSKTVIPGTNSTNCNWGPDEEPTLYVTAGNSVYKITNSAELSIGNNSRDGHLRDIVLYDPIPNPLTDVTTISFHIEKECRIHLSVIDISGKEIITLADSQFSSGRHSLTWITSGLPEGVYFIKMDSEGFFTIRQCVKVGEKLK